jgi:hypothetical protein
MSVHDRKSIPELPNVPATGVNANTTIFWFYAFCLWECLIPVHRAMLLHCSIGHAGFKLVIGCGHGGSRLRAVPVQAGKVCNHRASPNRHLSSIPRNGYGPANMQCAARATAHREPLVDGKLEDQLMTAFGKMQRSVPSAVQGPQRAGSSPYELALNRNFSGHNYTLREKRFEL